MEQPKQKEMTITVDVATGNFIKVTESVGGETVDARELKPDEVEEMYKKPNGMKYVATILHAHSSPG